jgi:hypothetical protein
MSDIRLRLTHFATIQKVRSPLQKVMFEAVKYIEELENAKMLWSEHNRAYEHLYTAYQEAMFRAHPTEQLVAQFNIARKKLDAFTKKRKTEIVERLDKQLKTELRNRHAEANPSNGRLPGFYWAPRFRGRRRLVLRSVDRRLEQCDGPFGPSIQVPPL